MGCDGAILSRRIANSYQIAARLVQSQEVAGPFTTPSYKNPYIFNHPKTVLQFDYMADFESDYNNFFDKIVTKQFREDFRFI